STQAAVDVMAMVEGYRSSVLLFRPNRTEELPAMNTTTRTFALASGRTLAYTDEGDSGAPALVFHHGFMACRLTGRPSPAARVITVDRPGIGASDADATRTVVGWVDDVTRLADHLELEEFSVLGHSGGSPYALACAWRLPERVRALGVACGFAPFDRP